MVQEKGIQVLKCAVVTLLKKKKKKRSIGKAIEKICSLKKINKLIIKLLLILLFYTLLQLPDSFSNILTDYQPEPAQNMIFSK